MVRNLFHLVVLLGSVGLCFVAGSGCADQTADKLIRCQNETIQLKTENDRLNKKLADARQMIDQQQQQIKNLEKLGPARIKDLTHVDHIELDRLTGGYEENGCGYDSGVRVYIRPIDDSGHTIKAAGTVQIRLFELDHEPKLLGQCRLNAEALKKTWIGRLWTNHYTIKCPFEKKPTSSNITVYVEYVELLTGKPFVTQQLIQVKIPPLATRQSTLNDVEK